MKDKFAEKSQNWDNPIKVVMAERFVQYMNQHIPLLSLAKVIEFGCGTGLVGLQLANSVSHITMIDNSASMLSRLNEKIDASGIKNVTSCWGELSDYEGQEVDTIIGFMVLHHIENTQDVFDTAYLALKEGGSLIIGDLSEEDGSFHAEETVPHNGFNLEALYSMAKKSRFKTVSVREYDRRVKGDKEYPLFFMVAHK